MSCHAITHYYCNISTKYTQTLRGVIDCLSYMIMYIFVPPHKKKFQVALTSLPKMHLLSPTKKHTKIYPFANEMYVAQELGDIPLLCWSSK